MKRLLVTAGAGLTTLGLGGVVAYWIAVATTSGRHSALLFWVFGGVAAVGAFSYLVGQERTDRRTLPSGSETQPGAPQPTNDEVWATWNEQYEIDHPDTGPTQERTGPAFTGLWHHTSDGFEASPLMTMANLAMPGFFAAHGQEPYLRVGVCVGSDPLPRNSSSSELGTKLLGFLRRDPVSTLINSVIGADSDRVWTRHAGNGALSLEAVQNRADGKPTASALFQPALQGIRLHGRNENIACLWLHIDPRGEDGELAGKADFSGWYRRFLVALEICSAFTDFLGQDLGIRTSEDPPARVGFMIETVRPISELVDTGSVPVLPGGYTSNQFLGYAIADHHGNLDDRMAKDLLRQLCDHHLHLGDFDGVLESISASNVATHQPTPCQPQGVPRTWETRELPVLRAVVKLLEQQGSFEATVTQISDETGIDKAEVDRAIEALKGEYIAEYQQFLTGGDPSTWAVRGITPGARRAVGQWPEE